MRPEPKIERIFYNFREAQEFLDISHGTMYRLMKQGASFAQDWQEAGLLKGRPCSMDKRALNYHRCLPLLQRRGAPSLLFPLGKGKVTINHSHKPPRFSSWCVSYCQL